MSDLVPLNEQWKEVKSYSANDFSHWNPVAIGLGGFGVVYHGTLESDGQDVAVKVCRNGDEKRLAQELQNHSRISHDNVVKIFGTYMIEGMIGGIVIEYCPLGNLYDFIFKPPYMSYDISNIVSYVKQLASVLICFEKNGLSHRDLKPQNILLADDWLNLKVCDMGSTRVYDHTTIYAGTLMYSPPEVLKKRDQTLRHRPNSKNDTFSVGIILWQLVNRQRYPFAKDFNEESQAVTAFNSGKRPSLDGLNHSLQALISGCWAHQPKNRWNAKRLQREVDVFAGSLFKRVPLRKPELSNPYSLALPAGTRENEIPPIDLTPPPAMTSTRTDLVGVVEEEEKDVCHSSSEDLEEIALSSNNNQLSDRNQANQLRAQMSRRAILYAFLLTIVVVLIGASVILIVYKMQPSENGTNDHHEAWRDYQPRQDYQTQKPQVTSKNVIPVEGQMYKNSKGQCYIYTCQNCKDVGCCRPIVPCTPDAIIPG